MKFKNRLLRGALFRTPFAFVNDDWWEHNKEKVVKAEVDIVTGLVTENPVVIIKGLGEFLGMVAEGVRGHADG